jgi:hypothetical protein
MNFEKSDLVNLDGLIKSHKSIIKRKTEEKLKYDDESQVKINVLLDSNL